MTPSNNSPPCSTTKPASWDPTTPTPSEPATTSPTWLGRAGRVDNAIEQLTTLLDDQTRILGPDHPNTLTTRNNLDLLRERRG